MIEAAGWGRSVRSVAVSPSAGKSRANVWAGGSPRRSPAPLTVRSPIPALRAHARVEDRGLPGRGGDGVPLGLRPRGERRAGPCPRGVLLSLAPHPGARDALRDDPAGPSRRAHGLASRRPDDGPPDRPPARSAPPTLRRSRPARGPRPGMDPLLDLPIPAQALPASGGAVEGLLPAEHPRRRPGARRGRPGQSGEGAARLSLAPHAGRGLDRPDPGITTPAASRPERASTSRARGQGVWVSSSTPAPNRPARRPPGEIALTPLEASPPRRRRRGEAAAGASPDGLGRRGMGGLRDEGRGSATRGGWSRPEPCAGGSR